MYYSKIHSKFSLKQENQFNPNLMNSIGVDFKLKIIELEDKTIKLQIVKTY
jgi:hypothetical protein